MVGVHAWASCALLLMPCLLGTSKAYSCELVDKTKYTRPRSAPARSTAELNNPYCNYPACNSYREWGCGLSYSCYDDTDDSVCVSEMRCAAYVPCTGDPGRDCVRSCDDPPAGWQPKVSPVAVARNSTPSPVKVLKRTLYSDEDCTEPLVFGDFQKANENLEWKVQLSCQVFLLYHAV
jgi:hypothetical protein